MKGFRNRRSAQEFWWLCLATFLCFATKSQTALLSVIFERGGMPMRDIGTILSATGVTIILFTLAAGPLATRFGSLAVLRCGILAMLIAHLSYQLTFTSLPAAIVSRLLEGAGFGLFVPSAATLAKSHLSDERFVSLFGLFSGMVILPNAIGPLFAEVYLNAYGEGWFFVVGAVPAVAGMALTSVLANDRVDVDSNGKLSIVRASSLPNLRIPLITIFFVGMIFGFVPSFMAPLLIQQGIGVAYFFTSYTITMFLVRFFFLRFVETVPRLLLVAVSIGCMATAYLLVGAFGYVPSVIIGGLFFGIGYAIAYPVLSAMVSQQFSPHQRATPVAVFNAVFQSGIMLTPYISAFAIERIGYPPVLHSLAVLGFLSAVFVLVAQRYASKVGGAVS